MNEKQKNVKDWDPCASGEMGHLVAGLRSKRRTQQVKMLTGASAAAVVLLLLGNLAISINEGPEIAGLTCRDVEKLAEDFVDNKLDPELSAQVERHVEQCQHCRATIAKLRKQRAQGNVATEAHFAPRRDIHSNTFAPVIASAIR